MNATSKTNATLKWRNRAARLELGHTNQAPTKRLKEILAAAHRLHSAHNSNSEPCITADLIRPRTTQATTPQIPPELCRRSYLRINPADNRAPLLISIIRSLDYESITRRPVPRGQAQKLPLSLIPKEIDERWHFAIEELTGPRWIQADITPVHEAAFRAPKHAASLVSAVLKDAQSRADTGWLPEELKWLEQCTGAKAIIQQVYLYTQVQEAVPASDWVAPETLNASHLNVAYGWWLESVVAAHDTPSGLCMHWVTLYEYLHTLKLALTLAKEGGEIIAFGMGVIAVAKPDQEQTYKLHQIALTEHAQLLSSQEGRLPVPEALSPPDLPESAKPALIYSRLLSTPNASQITRLFEIATEGPCPTGHE